MTPTPEIKAAIEALDFLDATAVRIDGDSYEICHEAFERCRKAYLTLTALQPAPATQAEGVPDMPEEIWLVENPELDEDDDNRVIWTTDPDVYPRSKLTRYVRGPIYDRLYKAAVQSEGDLQKLRAELARTPAQAVDVEALVNEFLIWPLPESVCVDPCATSQQAGRSGTNLLTHTEIEAFFHHLAASGYRITKEGE